eukprot:Colp12_sorted_trinity150504_noHs@17095
MQGSCQILFVSSRARPNEWILPKGGWENDETAEESAKREAMEEAGVIGEVVQFLGEFDLKLGKTRMHAFELKVSEVLDKWPEMDERERRWVCFEEAASLCQRPAMLQALQAFLGRVRTN